MPDICEYGVDRLSEEADLPRLDLEEKGELSTGLRRRLALGWIGISSG